MTIKHWYGCYSDGWQNEIVSEAFSHPAKFARGLIRRIYWHAIKVGYRRVSPEEYRKARRKIYRREG